MIRKLRTAALLLTGPAVLVLGSAAAGPASAESGTVSGAANSAAACVTSFPIEVNGFAFDPSAVRPGNSSTADLITTNCTNVSVATDEEWTGQWLPLAGTGPAPGCPAIDPLIRAVDYAPGQELAENTIYLVPVGCEAAELAVTVKITLPAGSAASSISVTAYLRIEQIAQ
jgi:hypothetical protein